jgi:tRNA (cytidine/uridine-2'-O-)-methyltransferase
VDGAASYQQSMPTQAWARHLEWQPEWQPPIDGARSKCYSQCVKYEPLLHVVLHQPEIPHNAGSVGRTCVAVGAKLWMVGPLGFRTDDYYLRRSGLDYWERLEWQVVDSWEDLTRQLHGQRWWYFSKSAVLNYASVPYARGDVLVFGDESRGLPGSMLEEHRDHALRIPIRDQVRSLNLSNAVAIVVYEAMRQWGFPTR